MKNPNPLLHLIFSMLKSIVRITGCVFALVAKTNKIEGLVVMLITAELIGILEELF